jgi:4-diphosphocytidyl-2-C-methyl-D-erythritol kinase
VNFFLSVGKKDARGMHPVRSVFQAVGLCDELFIGTTEKETSLTCNWPWLGKKNTVWRALKLVSEIAQIPNMEVALVKHIPAQSGLGGGSSDAAGLLRAVDKMTGIGGQAELKAVAFAVGADVPFFLTGGRAKATGYGQKIMPLPEREREWLLVAKPEVSCSTAEMYAKLDALDYEWRDFPEDDNVLYNDFERVAPAECLELIERLCNLDARDAGLSGSGSAVFGRFDSEPLAEIACERLMDDFEGHAWVVPTLSRQESLDISVQTAVLPA